MTQNPVTHPVTRNSFPPVHDDRGLVTLGTEALQLREALESVFVGWARRCGAELVATAPLARVEDLARYDYFVNFPHLALAAAPVDAERARQLASGAEVTTSLASDELDSADLVLPSAACYNLYSALSGRRLASTTRVSTVAQCFRRETHYDGLRRLHGFTMREIVAIGDADTVQQHLEDHRLLVLHLADHLGLDLAVEVATDPFFEADGSRAVMQRMFPTKREFVTPDGLAIASVNYHRNFFGERADIEVNGETAHTACVAFGVERWIDTLRQRFDGDWDLATATVRAFADRTDVSGPGA